MLQSLAQRSHVISALRSLGRHLLLPSPMPVRHPIRTVPAAFRGDTGEPSGLLRPGVGLGSGTGH